MTNKNSQMSVLSASIFLFGSVLGVGILTLPTTFKLLGWLAVVLLVFLASCFVFTGITLGKCWLLVREEFPQYKEECAAPYPVMGEKAFGKLGRVLIDIFLYIVCFGGAIVQLLVATENIANLFQQINVNINLCFWILAAGGFLIPFTWLKSPKSMWPIAIGSLASSLISSVLIIVQSSLDHSQNYTTYDETNLTGTSGEPLLYESIFTSFSLMMYALFAVGVFPSVQVDMRRPNLFFIPVIISLSGSCALYISTSTSSYIAYGDLVQENILLSLSKGWMMTTATILMTVQVLAVFVIILTPFVIAAEAKLKIPEKFGWKRIFLRSSINVLIIFVAMSCPSFGKVMALIGGSALPLLGFVFPPLFYWKLHNQFKSGRRPLSLLERFFYLSMICVGLVGSIASTYVAVKSIVQFYQFKLPCYLT